MKRRSGLHWTGAIIAICFASWMACNNGTGPSTVPAPPAAESPALQEAAASSTTMARVAETAALTEDVPPWHGCLHDDGGSWQADDGRRCVPIQALNTVTGWRRECGHNTAHFLSPDYQCCIDDGLGQCVPGSEKPFAIPPEETDPEEPEDPDIWFDGTFPRHETELCEGDAIFLVDIRRSDLEGALGGSIYLADPETSTRTEARICFTDGASLETTVLPLDEIPRCPDCSEVRNLVLGIDPQFYTACSGGDAVSYRVAEPLVFRVRKATDARCRQD